MRGRPYVQLNTVQLQVGVLKADEEASISGIETGDWREASQSLSQWLPAVGSDASPPTPIDEKSEAQRGQGPCPELHSQKVVELGLHPAFPDSKANAISTTPGVSQS